MLKSDPVGMLRLSSIVALGGHDLAQVLDTTSSVSRLSGVRFERTKGTERTDAISKSPWCSE